MGHMGIMGHVDFTYFYDIVNYSDNKGDYIQMIRNFFFCRLL